MRLTRPVLLWCGLALLPALGCAGKLSGTLLPNLLPTVELTAAPADTSALYFYRYRVQWSSFDPDGSVDHFLYAVDPPSATGAETTWVSTTESHIDLEFPSVNPIPDDPRGISTSPHTFVLAAVDDRGAIGPRETRSFFSFTQGPTVRITQPQPSNLTSATIATSALITWTGTDPDGTGDKKPVGYKYLLLGPSSPYPVTDFLSDPASIPELFAPDFPATDGWVDIGDTTRILLSNLNPGSQYVFVVVAFDQAGAYSPVFSLESNIVRLRASLAASHGPTITLFNDFFEYSYPSGGYRLEEAFWVRLEIPIDTQLRINWSAAPSSGTHLVSYRWSVDNQDLSDDTPRTDELTDLAHWSAPALSVTTALLGPFNGNTQDHYFYLEATDDIGIKSLGVIALTVVRGTFERPLLIVDDTRRNPDGYRSDGSLIDPIGPWPTAAELDTFLYARGGVPWRSYPGTSNRSPQGVFWGFPFETTGTRLGIVNLNIPLNVLGQYRNVVWLTDGKGATFRRSGQDWQQPQTSLYYMDSDNHVNSLGAYIAQGGNLWLMGGGIAMASTYPNNVGTNDRPTITFSRSAGELKTGRFMYSVAGWRSEIRTASAQARIYRYTGRLEGTSSPYDALPPQLEFKTAGSDPIQLYAPGRKTNEYFLTATEVEFLQKPNEVLGDGPVPGTEVSLMDTLYHGEAQTMPADTINLYNVLMTVFHPTPTNTVVCTGFAPWIFKRAQFVPLVDLVLNRLWGLPKNGPAAPALISRRAAGNAAPSPRLLRVPGGTSVRAPSGASVRAPSGTSVRAPGRTSVRAPSGTLPQVPSGTSPASGASASTPRLVRTGARPR